MFIVPNVYLSQHLKSPVLVEMWQFGSTLSIVLLLKGEVGVGKNYIITSFFGVYYFH